MLFKLSGTVVARSGQGQRLGCPTINLAVTKPVPWQFGSYAGYVQIDQQFYPAALYYGPVQPSQLEAHLLDFTGNLYQQQVTIQAYQLIRPHQVITNQATLIQTIQTDINAVRQCLAALPKPL